MMSIFLPSGLANVPKFSREQRMPISICFCGLRISEYILLIEPFTPDFTSKRQSYKWMFRDKRQSYEEVFYDKRQSYNGVFVTPSAHFFARSFGMFCGGRPCKTHGVRLNSVKYSLCLKIDNTYLLPFGKKLVTLQPENGLLYLVERQAR